MKAEFTADRKGLLDALATVLGFSLQRDHKPVLSYALFVCNNGECSITATDLEVGATVIVRKVSGEQDCRELIPITRAINALRLCSDDTVAIGFDKGKFEIRGSSFVDKSNTIDANDFPSVKSFDPGVGYCEAGGRFLFELINRTLFAADETSLRYALGGICIDITERVIVGAASDGHRCAMQSGPLATSSKATCGRFIIPMKSANLIRKSVGDCESVKIQANENEVIIVAGDVEIYSRLLLGRFPDLGKFSTPGNTRFTVPAGVLMVSLKQALLAADNEIPKTWFNASEGKIDFRSDESELGSSSSSIQISLEGGPYLIPLIGKYVIDMLNVLDGDSLVTVCYKDDESPMFFLADEGYQYFVSTLTKE